MTVEQFTKDSRMRMLSVPIILFAASFSLAMFTGCSGTKDQEFADIKANMAELKKEVKAAVADESAATDELEWLEYKRTAEDKIAANDKQIREYKVSMTGTNGTRRTKYNTKIDALELKNKELKAKLDNYPEDSKNTWEQFKNEFSRDLDELGSALKDFTVNNDK